MKREALKKMLSEVELKADAARDLEVEVEKERVRAEIAKLQAEHAKLKAETLLQEIQKTAPQRVTGRAKSGKSPYPTTAPFGMETCFWCDQQFSIFTLEVRNVTDSDGRSFCGNACMIAQKTFDHQELQAGLDYVKRSLGTDEEIA